ncbi:hypothetical protein QX204_06880 [Nocardia sp. PE-7]|uniref:hypothetical protein n=1 Tax=Nocardia sp. PE-7 TaxID=3058426 RepID=UPI00265AB0F1|nr:hypothetical protein [Nocardia sp. PE-7]WKG11185.1 hypothetical protein QX204_06880 [Nocardia sp. PE-7]
MSTANLTDVERQVLDAPEPGGLITPDIRALQSRPEGAGAARHHVSAAEEVSVGESARAVARPAPGTPGRPGDSRYVALLGALSGLENEGLACSVPLPPAELNQRASDCVRPRPTALAEGDLTPSRADLVKAFDAMKQAGWLR